ncbi:MAG: helix-turn-helix transcriptional regulator [Bacteroidota bacterium]
MKGTNLGEFEELVLLTVVLLQDEAYILKIREELKAQANRYPAMGALHATLSRLEKKDFLQSDLAGGTAERGGRRKRVYELTNAGKQALHEAHEVRNRMWGQIPEFALRLN